MATHSSVLAWRIPGTGEPGGLPSMGLHRVRHDWSNLAAEAAAKMILMSLKIWRECNRNWSNTYYFRYANNPENNWIQEYEY